MDWIVDNAIALSGLVLGLAVLIGLAVLVISVVVFWKRASRARARLETGRLALEESAARLAETKARLEGRQGDLQGQVAAIQADVEQLQILARYALEAESAIGAPLRFVGIKFLGRRG